LLFIVTSVAAGFLYISISSCPCLLVKFMSKQVIWLFSSPFVVNCRSLCCALKCSVRVWGTTIGSRNTSYIVILHCK
jgi:hypothetical protein